MKRPDAMITIVGFIHQITERKLLA